jgi:PhnB protein
MEIQKEGSKSRKFSIEPWLTLNNGEEAINFYKSAFNAIETYRLDDPNGGLVVRLSFNGAGLWISSESNSDKRTKNNIGNSIRMILIVDNPDSLYGQAIKAGATEIFPVGEDHGWRLGRLSDPFGLQWEIGYQLQG